MTKYILTVIDTISIQSYIFRSNRLRENIGASYLIDQATKKWVCQQLSNLKYRIHIPNFKDGNLEAFKPRIHADKERIDAELIYAGGGNTVLLFKTIDASISLVNALSRKFLEDAPGINIIAAHREFEWGNNAFLRTLNRLISQDLLDKKNQRNFSSPLLGLSVTVSCNSTQLVAIGNASDFNSPVDDDQDSYPVSREVSKKLLAVQGANHALKEIFSELPKKLEFPYRFDHLGRTVGESSYIAVIHADGNNIGDRFQKYCQAQTSDENSIKAIRRLSQSINKAGLKALLEVLREVKRLIVEEKFYLGENHKYFPFRPLVYGGDDVTFVCDGRLGLVLAAKYLQAFEAQKVVDQDVNGSLTACAGIAIVKTHYPFARAYALSEELCAKAKSFAKRSGNKTFSALDWHIAHTGLMGSVDDIRVREYQNGRLTMRPIRLNPAINEWQTWPGFCHVVNEFSTSLDWKGRRNKIMALRDVLRREDNSTHQFLQTYRLNSLPEFPEAEAELAKTGWLNGRCGYFDVIEVLDYFPD